jgi:signal peptide peptidase SppA
MRDSIVRTSIRTFIISLFVIFGLAVGIFIVLAIIGGVKLSENTPTSNYTLEYLPNADGVRKILSKSAPVILRVNINGVIGVEPLTAPSFREMLVESREDSLKNDRVKAILLYINSPGGTVSDADGIYQALKEYKEQYKVPIIAYVDGLCASGGMYVSAAADEVYASTISLVGSIGVIAPSFVNVSKVMEKIGIEQLTLYAGKGKDEMNPLRPWKPGEQDNLNDMIQYYYHHFVEIMTSSRKNLDAKALVEDYGAKIYPADEGVAKGYINEAGISYRDALNVILKKLSIEDKYYQVVQLDSSNWFTNLFKSHSSLLTGTVKHELVLPYTLDPKLNNQFLYLYKP